MSGLGSRLAEVRHVVLVVLGLALALFGSPFLRGHDETGKVSADVAGLARRLPVSSGAPQLGLYRVDGRDLVSHGFGGGARSSLRRQWLIARRCTATCVLWLTRTSSLGVLRAPLTERGGRWYATFTQRAEGCGTSRTGRAVQAFTLSEDPDQHHIRALEAKRATFPGCRRNGAVGTADVHAYGKVTWTATRVGADCDLHGCRTSIPDPGPSVPDDPGLAAGRRQALAACARSGRGAAQCLCTMRRVLAWTAPSVIGVMLGALDGSQRVDRLSAAQVRRDALACV